MTILLAIIVANQRQLKSEYSKEDGLTATEAYWWYVGGAGKTSDEARRSFSDAVTLSS